MSFASHPVTLRQLQYVVAVAEQKSFRKAALICAVSQPALSAQVAQLEGALGVTIFDRDTTRVLITSQGQRVLEKARAVLSAADALVDDARRDADPLSGVLRLGVIPTVAPYLLPEVATPLREQFPKLRFSWIEDRTTSLAKRLHDGELDGAIVAMESESLGDVQAKVLGKDSFVLATANSHELAKSDATVSTKVLDHERVLVLEEGHCLGEQVAAVCSRLRNAELDVRSTSLTTLAQMVAGGEGVTLLPELALPVENRRGQFHVRRFSQDVPSRTLALVWRKGTPALAALRAIAPVLSAGVSHATTR